MTAPDVSKQLEESLNSLIDQALKYVEQLSGDPSGGNPEKFNEAKFKEELTKGAAVLSHNATKVGYLLLL